MVQGIYLIRNKVNQKVYVGSSFNCEGRFTKHFNMLKKGRHFNEYFQNSFNKYGVENFETYILEVVENEDDLLQKEEDWIEFYNGFDRNHGFNVQIPTRTRISQEVKDKISVTMSGRQFSESHIRALSQAKKGIPWPENRKKVPKGGYASKLTFAEAEEIRESRKKGVSYKEVCIKYNITEGTYYNIINNKFHKK